MHDVSTRFYRQFTESLLLFAPEHVGDDIHVLMSGHGELLLGSFFILGRTALEVEIEELGAAASDLLGGECIGLGPLAAHRQAQGVPHSAVAVHVDKRLDVVA